MSAAINPKRKGIISIDFWFTMVDGRVGGEVRNRIRLEALNKIAQSNNAELQKNLVKEAYAFASAEFEKIWLQEQRTMSTKDLVGLVLQKLGLKATDMQLETLSKVYAESLWDGPPALAPGLQEAIPKLAEHYDLGIISDTMYSPGTVLRVFLEKNGLLKYFKAFVFSDEVGYSKPDKRAFESIREQLQSSSEETAYHIGDLVKTDIKGANQSGYQSVQYTGLNFDGHTKDAKHVLENWKDSETLFD